MNDFTKEELIHLHYLLLKSQPSDLTIYRKIHEKLELLIGQYCIHDYKKTLSRSGMHFMAMCHKCHDIKPCDENEALKQTKLVDEEIK